MSDLFVATPTCLIVLCQVGRLHLVLVEGPGKSIKQDSSATTATTWTGRTDTNKRVVIPLAHDLLQPSPVLAGLSRAEAMQFAGLNLPGTKDSHANVEESTTTSTAANENDDESDDVLVAGTSSSSSAAALMRGLEAVAVLVRDVADSRPSQQQPVFGEIEKGEYICGFYNLFR